MTNLPGKQIQVLQDALLEAYGSQSSLRRMVQIHLDKNLDAIAGGSDLTAITFNLITWAIQRGQIEELLDAAIAGNPGNQKLANTIAELQATADEEGETMTPDNQSAPKTWLEQIAEQAGRDDADAGNRQGDVIVATVGSGAKNIAIGKNITQTISETLGPATPDDREIIETEFAKIESLTAHVDAQIRQMVDLQLSLLKGELTKTGEDETPSASTITQVGDWLLDNVGEITQTLTALFGLPAVGRVLGKAGESAVDWARKRFE